MSRSFSLGTLALGLVAVGPGPRKSDRAQVIASIDSLINAPIKAGKLAGASVAVVHGKDTLVLKGYGMADLELDVPTPPDATYEIGSVTKQFTAVGIMQLVEQGKISLDADITTYLPDYPTQGNRITIQRLLDHTSGIKGATEIPEFRGISMSDVPRDSLVKVFSAKPFDFPPGEQETYNNSAFMLAGIIIEKVSGMSYADYVQKKIFEPAGMTRSYYCSEKTIRKNHAHGYDTDATGLVNKGFVNHKWPFAAGSLCSTAGDLARWNYVLHRTDKLMKRDTYRELIKPGVLNDGTKIRYAKGLALVDIAGRKAISHGGDINGFASFSAYLPDDDLTIVVLFNSEGPARPDQAAGEIAKIVLGPAPEGAQAFSGDLASYAGSYTGRGRGRDMTLMVKDTAGVLRLKRFPTDSGQGLTYLGGETWSAGGALVIFDKKDGKPVRLRFDAGYGYNLLSRQ
jgi:CubicO group peptidase (beta-lactamase class C family)